MIASIIQHLPVIQILLPLLSAPLCLLLRRNDWVWLLTMFASLLCLSASVVLLHLVLQNGPISYALGGWEPPWGIEYRVDVLNGFVLLIVSMIATLVAAYAGKSVAKEIPAHNQPLFYTAFLLCLAGLLGITITGDAFNLFVFLEISSLSSYILISLGQDRRALTSAFQYLVIGTIGATFILIGVGLLYMMTGTLNMADLARRLPDVMHTRTIPCAFAFIIIGVSIKLALFPLHLWLPNAYTYAPSVASAFLAATATKVSLYVLLRFVFTIFGAAFAFGVIPLQPIFLAISLMAIFAGSFSAIFQDNIKRMLAYSSIAQIGYMALGISLGTTIGVSAGILHLFNHALMKGGLFMALGCIFYMRGSTTIKDFAGLGLTMPWTMAAIVIGGLSLIGVPLTAGFISKWVLVSAALESGLPIIAALVLIGSLLAAIYVWRLVEAAYFNPPSDKKSARAEAPLSLLIPTWILIAANIYFGLNTDLSIGVATLAAQSLLEAAP